MKYFTIFLVLIGIISCKNTPEEASSDLFKYSSTFNNQDSIKIVQPNRNKVKHIVIPADITTQSIRIDTLLQDMRVVPLETTEKCLVGKIDKILFLDHHIILVSTSNEPKILVFDNNGQFVTKIGENGRGPSEYNKITDVAIDYTAKQIVVLDASTQKILFYNLKNELAKIKKLYYNVYQFFIFDRGYLCHQFMGANPNLPKVNHYQITVADSSGKIAKRFFSYDLPKRNKSFYFLNHDTNLSEHNGKVLFRPFLSNDIYEFQDSNNVNLKYSITLGAKNLLNRLENVNSLEEMLTLENEYKLQISSGPVLEAGNYFYSKIDNGGLFYYNNNTGKLIYGNSFSVLSYYTKPDMLPKFPYQVEHTIATTDSEFVAVVYPSELMMGMSKDQSNIQFSDLKKSISELDNPILIFYTLKE